MKYRSTLLRPFIVILVTILGLSAQANDSGTVCSWENHRDGMNFESISSINAIKSIRDCAHALAITSIVLEPVRGASTYDGTFFLRDGQGQIIDQCESRTIRPATNDERAEIMEWLFNHREELSDQEYLEQLSTPVWQERIQQNMEIHCEALVS